MISVNFDTETVKFNTELPLYLFLERMEEFNVKLTDIINVKTVGVHIILDDPAGNSFLQNVYAPEDDPEMEVVHYERTFEHNEELGVNDMKLENYENDPSDG